MPPLNSVLIPHSSLSGHEESFNLLIKLNNDIIHTLKTSLLQNDSVKPKLIVKNGEYYLKLDQNLLKTKKFKESSRIDLYSNGHDVCLDLGKIDMRLNVLYNDKSRLKRIQAIERPRSELNSTGSSHVSLNSRSVPNSPRLRLVDYAGDEALVEVRKLIHLLSLGPITIGELNKIVKIDAKIVAKFGKVYDPNDGMRYIQYSDSNDTKYVLRDAYYKDLSLYFYTDSERSIILQNIDLKLTTLGYNSENPTKLNITRGYDKILHDLQQLKAKKSQEKELRRKLEETKKKDEILQELKRKEEKKHEDNIEESSTRRDIKVKKTTTPPPVSKSKETKRKRTISESSNSSVNSMKLGGDNVESPITSQEEIDDDISLNEVKRQRVIKLSSEQLELLKKFRSKYQIYSNLHQSLSASKHRSRTEFQKLATLENEVKTLKRKLWKLEAK